MKNNLIIFNMLASSVLFFLSCNSRKPIDSSVTETKEESLLPDGSTPGDLEANKEELGELDSVNEICFRNQDYPITKTGFCRDMDPTTQGVRSGYSITITNLANNTFTYRCQEKSQTWIDVLDDSDAAASKADMQADYRTYAKGRVGDKTRFHWNNLEIDSDSNLVLNYYRTDQERGVGGRCETAPKELLTAENFDFSVTARLPTDLDSTSTGVFTVALFSVPFDVAYEMDILFGLRSDSSTSSFPWIEPQIIMGNPKNTGISPSANAYRTRQAIYQNNDGLTQATTFMIKKRGPKCTYFINDIEVAVSNDGNADEQFCRSPADDDRPLTGPKMGMIVVNSRGNYVDKRDGGWHVDPMTGMPLVRDGENRDQTPGVIIEEIRFTVRP